MVQHASTRVAKCLLARHIRAMQRAEARAPRIYVPTTLVEAQKLIAFVEGSVVSSGRQNLERFNAALLHLETKCGFKLGYLQKRLLNIGRLILIKRMFGSQLDAEKHYLRTRIAVKRYYEQAAVILPRRAGKTVAQTILAALVAATQPDGNVCCFNLGSRQSKAWLSQAMKWLEYFKGTEWDWKLKSINNKEYIIFTNCCGTLVAISSYPGPRDVDASNYRGVGERLMLLLYDEFYFFKEVVYNTTLPLAKNGAAILLISSMSKNYDDAVRRMVYAKMDEDDDRDLFLRLDWLRACPECVARGTASSCDHVEHLPQHFEPRGALRRMKQLISPFGKENFERELMNTAARSNRTPVLQASWLAPLRDPANDYRAPTVLEYDEFFVGVDPSGDGFSRTAVVSLVFDKFHRPSGLDYRCLVVASEVLPGKRVVDVDLGDVIVQHVLRVRAHIPELRLAKAIICIENNSILVPAHIIRAIKRNPNHHKMGYMMENSKARRRGAAIGNGIDLRAGTRTTHSSKESIIHKLQDLLLNNALHFHPRFFIPHPERQPLGEHTEAAARQLFVDELAFMSMEYIPSRGPVASLQQSGHCKYRGIKTDGTRAWDDKFMALGFCLQCQPLYQANPSVFVRMVTADGF